MLNQTIIQSTTPGKKNQWQFQSNTNPWDESEEKQWTNYSNSDHEKIEEAYLFNLAEVELDNYNINLIKMLQINKNDKAKQRRIRKDGKPFLLSRFIYFLPPPLKISHDSENLPQCLKYIFHRNLDCIDIFKSLTSIDDINKENPLSKGLQAKAYNAIMNVGDNIRREFHEELLKISDEIYGEYEESSSNNLKATLQNIIQMYTWNSFIWLWANRLYKSDSWGGNKSLGIFLTFLIDAFERPEMCYKIEIRESNLDKFKNFFSKPQPKLENLIFYKGTALKEEEIKAYQEMKELNILGIISVVQNRDFAEEMIDKSMESADERGEKREKAILIFEFIVYSNKPILGMINASEYSGMSPDGEFLLSPKYIYKVVSYQKKGEVHEITLRPEYPKTQNHIDFEIKIESSSKRNEDTVNISNLWIEEVEKALVLVKGNKNIKNLEISKCDIDNFTQAKLFEVVSTLPNLSKLRLDLGMFELKQEGRKKLAKLIKNLKLLNSLFYDFTNFTSTSITYLAMEEILTGLIGTNIQSLNLDFTNCSKVCNKGMNHLSKVIEELKIVKLNLTFGNIPELSDVEVEQLSTSIKMHASKIRYLIIDFKNCPSITDQGLENFFASIQEFKELIELSFAFTGTQGKITNRSLAQFNNTSITQAFPKLKSIALNFKDSILLRDPLSNFFTTTEENKIVEKIDLNFGGCDSLDSEKIKKLFSELIKYSNVKTFRLNFGPCAQIDDEILKNLYQCLDNFTSLEVLDIDLSKNHMITKESFAVLSDSLKKIKTITSLSLNLSSCTELRSKEIELIAEICSSLKNLQVFNLNLEKNISLEDEDFNLLYTKIESNSTLKNFTINFNMCKISETILKKFTDLKEERLKRV